ncbi:hypothetical protein IBL28_13740 [Sinomicrobium sp. FJxs]|uniref:Uncharacterized protein n=1 Tax=Sinomicrobium weinanense TaxID=2842200 RepID=A0A926Q4F9_9FLAO|nr:hypothetical protein [Sinomicrobium weinanense]MBC9797036.1 hypothetical protein [Sinomicrobium weinanense]MBU3122031.1 hypothetical protein [Sinomicrobium weinanense]
MQKEAYKAGSLRRGKANMTEIASSAKGTAMVIHPPMEVSTGDWPTCTRNF